MSRKNDSIDDLIRAALDEEESELYDDLGEQALPAMAFAVFRGRSRWLTVISMALGSVFLVLGILSASSFYNATELRDFMIWGGAAAFCFSTVWAMKVWYWMEMQRHAITREIKRVELQLAHLASRVATDQPTSMS